jgi:hypothetical protein
MTEDFRPPSRHKTPPNAVGLDLPPWPVTPPDSNILEMTWSHTNQEIDMNQRKTAVPKSRHNEPLKAYRPITVNAWEKDERSYVNSRVTTAKNRYTGTRKASMHNFDAMQPGSV